MPSRGHKNIIRSVAEGKREAGQAVVGRWWGKGVLTKYGRGKISGGAGAVGCVAVGFGRGQQAWHKGVTMIMCSAASAGRGVHWQIWRVTKLVKKAGADMYKHMLNWGLLSWQEVQTSLFVNIP